MNTTLIAIGAAVAVFTGIGAGIGIGIATSKATEAVARQPEAEGKISKLLLLGCALAEATAIYGFVIALLIILLFFSVKGLIRGLVQEVAGLLGVAAGIVLARTFSAQFAPVLSQYGVSPGFAPMLSMALLFLAGSLWVLLCRWDRVPGAVEVLLESAFDFRAVTGGGAGAAPG